MSCSDVEGRYKHLSMNATLLEVLQNANALEILIRILDEQSSGPHSTVSFSLFSTCGDYRIHLVSAVETLIMYPTTVPVQLGECWKELPNTSV